MITPAIRFLRDARGTIGVEAMLMLPLMVWAYLAMFVYWEAFRVENTNTKAAYTIADTLSREFNRVDDDDVQGLANLYAFLTRDRYPTRVRISSIGWDIDTDNYAVLWSRATDDQPELTTATVEGWEDRLPDFPAGDTILLIETVLDYDPTFNIGLQDRGLTQFVFTRPRFVTAVGHVDVPGSATGVPGEVAVAGG